jgi:hypothetical protein
MLDPRSISQKLLHTFLLSACCFAVSALGQNDFTYVSAETGSDTSANCSHAAPCREISRAFSVTNSGGTVRVVSDGRYSGLGVTRSVSIVAAPDVKAVVAGLNISGSSLNLYVRLNGLFITPSSPGYYGMTINSASSPIDLTMEDCVVSGSETAVNVLFAGTYRFRNVRFLSPIHQLKLANENFSSGTIKVTVDGCQFEGGGSGYGIDVEQGAQVTVANSTFSDNETAVYTGGMLSTLFIENSLITRSQASGIVGDNYSGITVSNTTVTYSGAYGIENKGTATIYSFVNNRLNGNRSGDTSGIIRTKLLK